MIHETANISPLAHVDPQAQIGANVEVAPFAFIGPNVTVGAGAWIGPHATVLGDTTIGEECKLFPGCVIGADSQDLKYKGEPTTVEIGARTSIRECVMLTGASIIGCSTLMGGAEGEG